MLKKVLPVFILIVLSYWSIKPFLLPGFFPMHDNTQVQRVFEMKQSLTDGMFPVRWVSDLGYNYGYPIFNFYAPLSYYVGATFNLIGFDSLTATKMMMALGTLLAGVFMYFLAKAFWGRAGGILAGLLYLYAPYHAVNIFVRGAVAELWAYAFVPLAFFGLYKVYTTLIAERIAPKKQGNLFILHQQKLLWLWIAVGAIGYAGIVLSHNLTAMMVTPFLFLFAVMLYVVARMKGAPYPYTILVSFLMGIILSAFYWLPTLQEMQYTNVVSQIGGKSDFTLHFVCPMQVWDSQWGFGGSTLGCIDGMSFKIGKLHILLALISLFAIFFMSKKQKTTSFILLFFLAVLLFSTFIMFRESFFIWKLFPQMAFFQFPWRFLIMVCFVTAFLGGAAMWLIAYILDKTLPQQKITPIVLYCTLFVISTGVILLNGKLFVPQTITQATAKEYTNPYHLQWITSRISDEYMPVGFKKPRKSDEMPKQKIVLSDAKAQITFIKTQTHMVTAVVDTPVKTTALVHIAHFPAWHTYLNNKEVSYTVVNNGLQVEIPPGKHTLTATFIQTPIEMIGNIVSLTGFIALLLGIIITQRKDLLHAKKST